METKTEFCDYQITTDPNEMCLDTIHGFLKGTYWAAQIPRPIVVKCMENSLCCAVLFENRTVAFARVISDLATFAYICDVFVIEKHRGRGLAKKMMVSIMQHPDLQGLRRWSLATRDAHKLYEKFGFTPLRRPERFMEIQYPDVYTAPHPAQQREVWNR